MVTAKEITVDRINIVKLENYRFQSLVFNLPFTENNIAGVPQTANLVLDGFWILSKPLSPGSHRFTLRQDRVILLL